MATKTARVCKTTLLTLQKPDLEPAETRNPDPNPQTLNPKPHTLVLDNAIVAEGLGLGGWGLQDNALNPA